jgi:DNA-binding NtrC family response regulator
MWRGVAVCYVRTNRFPAAQEAIRKSIEVFEACGNEWELAKTYVVGAEGGLFAPAEVKAKLVQAREVFQELEYPAWEKRVEELLERKDFADPTLPLPEKVEHIKIYELKAALEKTGWNRTQAARLLGITEGGVRWLIKDLGLKK